jgi:hypothetical protein
MHARGEDSWPSASAKSIRDHRHLAGVIPGHRNDRADPDQQRRWREKRQGRVGDRGRMIGDIPARPATIWVSVI